MTEVHGWEYDQLFAPSEKPNTEMQCPSAPFQLMESDPIVSDHIAVQWSHMAMPLPGAHAIHSPSHSSSHCSSPWTGEVEPVWLEADLSGPDDADSTARTTPITQQQQMHTNEPLLSVQQYQVMVQSQQTMPTIAEQGIGMLPTMDPPTGHHQPDVHMAPSQTLFAQRAAQPPSSASSATSSVRSKRRTRYTTAAAASVAARASVGHHSGSLPSSPPMLETATSRDSSRNMDVTSTGSAHSSEQEEDDASRITEERNTNEEFHDEEYEEVSPGKHSKRKRTAGGAKHALMDDDEDCPQMKGLDKRERNKLSASMYRKRRKVYLDSLEGKVGELDATIAKQSETIARQQHENKVLKEQLSFLKKMVAGLPKSFGGMSDESQSSNVHIGAGGGPRRTLGQSAGAFLFLVLAVCVLLNPTSFGGPDAASEMAIGRRGRTLLSVDESTLDLATSEVSSPFGGLGGLPGFDAHSSDSGSVHVEYESLTAKALGTSSPMRSVEFTFEFLRAGVASVFQAVTSSFSTAKSLLTGGGGMIPASN